MCDCHTPKQDFIVMTCDSKLLHHVISMKLNIGKKMTELEIMTLNHKKIQHVSKLIVLVFKGKVHCLQECFRKQAGREDV